MPRCALLFILLALGLSVAYWALMLVAGPEPFGISKGVWGALRAYGPALAAILVALGTGELRELGRRVGRRRVPGRLIALSLGLPILANGIAVLVAKLSGADLTLGELRPGRMILVFFVLAIVDGPVGEEIGWRGYLLPKLLERMSPLAASAVGGVVWFVWHLPLYAADGRSFAGAFLPLYFVFTMAYAVIMTWLFLRSKESAFLAIFVHTATNYFTFVKMSLFPRLRETMVDEWVYVGIAVLLAFFAQRAWRAAHSSA